VLVGIAIGVTIHICLIKKRKAEDSGK